MHKFINSLAHTEYNKDGAAVEIDFNGFGSMQIYYQTMEIAASLVMLRKQNLWVLVKEDFQDLSAPHFFNFLKNWFKHPAFLVCQKECKRPCRVAIVTTPPCLGELKNAYKNESFSNEIPHNIAVGLFASKDAANAFLKQSYAMLQVYEHGPSFNYLLN
jgi:hypothetical protein